MSKRAVILAGGKGSRLRPYTLLRPKPLMPIAGYPIIEIIVEQLCSQGFDHITLAINRHSESIKNVLENGRKWGIRIDYSVEKMPLGTIGPLKLIENLPANFLLMNGDLLTDWDFSRMFAKHLVENSKFTIGLVKKSIPFSFGLIETDKNGNVETFEEKPQKEYYLNAGIYVMSKEIVEHIPADEPYAFDQLITHLLDKKEPVQTYKHTSYWQDIGCPEDYHLAEKTFEKDPVRFLPKLQWSSKAMVS